MLVTGGAGFIGSHLIGRLLSEGHEVVSVDNINEYYDPQLKRDRIQHFSESVALYEIDIANLDELSKVFDTHSFDLIYHIAAQAGVRYSISHPEVYIRSNEIGTKNVLELARVHGAPPVIFASSSSVYGDLTDTPFLENQDLGKALSVYAKTKQVGENLCREYADSFDMNITAVRFFTVYGPWGRPDMALFSFTEKILNGETIEIYNNGDMKRDFTYIDDIVDGLRLVALKLKSGFNIYNLGRGAPVALMSFVSVLEQALGVKANIVNKPMQPGDMRETYASTKKAEEELGFKANISIEEGVQNFVDWYRMYHNKNK